MVDDCMVWVEVASPVDFTPIWEHAVRLMIRGLPEGHLAVLDIDCWMVREKHVGANLFCASCPNRYGWPILL